MFSLAQLITRRPLTVVFAGLVLTCVAAALAVTRLGFKTARIELVGDVDFTRQHLALEAEFGDLNAIVVAIEAPPAQARAFAADLAAAVRSDTEAFRGTFVRVSPEDLGAQALLFLPAERLAALEAQAAALAPALREGAVPGALTGFARELRRRLDAGTQRQAAGDVALGTTAQRLLEETDRCLAGEQVPGSLLDSLAWDTEGYVWTADGGTLIALVDYNEGGDGLDPKARSVKRLRTLLAELQPRHPGVTVGLTGKPVLDVDELVTYEADSIRAGVIALVLVTLLLLLALRQLPGPLWIGGCLLLSLVSTLGLASIAPGHLNLMAVVFVVVVIGLGVDFGIHLVSRYEELRGEGLEPAPALSRAYVHTGPAIVAGALTTIGAFLAALATDFQGLREFGVVAALGVLAAAGVMLTVLPALLIRFDRRAHMTPFRDTRVLAVLDRLPRERPRAFLGGVVLLTAAAFLCVPGLTYDANLLRMQDPNLPSVQLEQRLFADEQLTAWFLAYATDDLDDLRRRAEAVRAVPGVKRVESILDRLPTDQAAKLPRARAIQSQLRRALAGPLPPLDRARLTAALDLLVATLEDALDQAVTGGAQKGLKTLEGLLEAAERAQARAGDADLTALAAYDARLAAAIERRARPLLSSPVAPLTPETLPPALKNRLVGKRGSYLLRIYAEDDLWEPDVALPLIARVRKVIPEVSGVPVLLHESSRLMADAYRRAGLYALIVVVLCLVLHFRAPLPTLLALLSLGVGFVWTAGALVTLGIGLNPANLVALPLLLGIGIDTSVHVIHRAQNTAPGEPLAASSLGRALVYSGLTTMASFGSLLAADHPGTASIGATISVGVVCCAAAGLLVPPALTSALGPPRSSTD